MITVASCCVVTKSPGLGAFRLVGHHIAGARAAAALDPDPQRGAGRAFARGPRRDARAADGVRMMAASGLAGACGCSLMGPPRSQRT